MWGLGVAIARSSCLLRSISATALRGDSAPRCKAMRTSCSTFGSVDTLLQRPPALTLTAQSRSISDVAVPYFERPGKKRIGGLRGDPESDARDVLSRRELPEVPGEHPTTPGATRRGEDVPEDRARFPRAHFEAADDRAAVQADRLVRPPHRHPRDQGRGSRRVRR